MSNNSFWAMKMIVMLMVVLAMSSLSHSKKDKIKLRHVEVLTLEQGKMTTGRRTRPIRQLQCIGGTAGCKVYKPSVVQCYNRGFDGSSIQWECKAEMGNQYKFGKVEVTCEGYDFADDDYILVGSCGLEYTIDLVKKPMNYDSYIPPNNERNNFSPDVESFSTVISMVLIVAVILMVMYCCVGNGRRTTAPPPPGFRPEFMNTDAPPPYPGTSSDHDFKGNAYSQPGQSTFRPGFWSGFFGGGTLGYLFGRRGNRSDRFQGSSRYQSFNDRASTSTHSNTDDTHVSSGFGGTKRR